MKKIDQSPLILLLAGLFVFIIQLVIPGRPSLILGISQAIILSLTSLSLIIGSIICSRLLMNDNQHEDYSRSIKVVHYLALYFLFITTVALAFNYYYAYTLTLSLQI